MLFTLSDISCFSIYKITKQKSFEDKLHAQTIIENKTALIGSEPKGIDIYINNKVNVPQSDDYKENNHNTMRILITYYNNDKNYANQNNNDYLYQTRHCITRVGKKI